MSIQVNLKTEYSRLIHVPVSSDTGNPLYVPSGLTGERAGEDSVASINRTPEWSCLSRHTYNSPTNVRRLVLTSRWVYVGLYTPYISSNAPSGYGTNVIHKTSNRLHEAVNQILYPNHQNHQDHQDHQNYTLTGDMTAPLSTWVLSNLEELVVDETVLLSSNISNNIIPYETRIKFARMLREANSFKTFGSSISKCKSAILSYAVPCKSREEVLSKFPRLQIITVIPGLGKKNPSELGLKSEKAIVYQLIFERKLYSKEDIAIRRGRETPLDGSLTIRRYYKFDIDVLYPFSVNYLRSYLRHQEAKRSPAKPATQRPQEPVQEVFRGRGASSQGKPQGGSQSVPERPVERSSKPPEILNKPTEQPQQPPQQPRQRLKPPELPVTQQPIRRPVKRYVEPSKLPELPELPKPPNQNQPILKQPIETQPKTPPAPKPTTQAEADPQKPKKPVLEQTKSEYSIDNVFDSVGKYVNYEELERLSRPEVIYSPFYTSDYKEGTGANLGITFITPYKTAKILKLTPENSVVITPKMYRSHKESRKLLSTLTGTEFELSSRWRTIVNAVEERQNLNSITRVVITNDALAFNNRQIIGIGVLGGVEGVEVKDIVNFSYLASRCKSIREILIDNEIYEIMFSELGDDPIMAVFNIFKHLNKLTICDIGCGADIKVYKKSDIYKEQARRDMEYQKQRIMLKSGIDAVAAAKNPRINRLNNVNRVRLQKKTAMLTGDAWERCKAKFTKKETVGGLVMGGLAIAGATVSGSLRLVNSVFKPILFK